MMRNDEKGAVAVLVSVMLVLLVVCVALVVDLGHIHNVKVQLQRAVDAAALAGAQQLPDAVKADGTAVKVAGLNQVDTEALSDAIAAGTVALTVDFGNWDDSEDAFGQPASVRYNSLGPAPPPALAETPNAVAVTATREVDHIFFWFLPSTTVTTDAIAVTENKPLTIPIVVVSCIPTGVEEIQTPGTDICDLSLFTFQGGPDDNAGWTGLTIVPANPKSAEIFMNKDSRDCGLRLFNQVVYGTETSSGLETATIKSGGCSISDNETHFTNIDTATCTGLNPITCGLGGEFSPQTPPDPLLFTTLPRWYNSDAILDVSTMRGLLSQGAESDAEYQVRMARLYCASRNYAGDPCGTPYSFADYQAQPGYSWPTGFPEDDRFARYIDPQGNKDNPTGGTPNFSLPIEEAGYPVVDVTNGVTDVIDFVREITVDPGGTTFSSSLRSVYEPLDDIATALGEGETVLLTLPIIWSKDCENKFVDGFYVGTANLLLTRLWETTQEDKSYDNGENSVLVGGGFANASTCSDRFDEDDDGFFGPDKRKYVLPGLTAGRLRRIGGFSGKSFEGLLLDPTRGEESETGIRKIYLVE